MAQTLGYRTSATVEVAQIVGGKWVAVHVPRKLRERSLRHVVRFTHAFGPFGPSESKIATTRPLGSFEQPLRREL
jgi:hypothetical protein